jgi:hypothetical protein
MSPVVSTVFGVFGRHGGEIGAGGFPIKRQKEGLSLRILAGGNGEGVLLWNIPPTRAFVWGDVVAFIHQDTAIPASRERFIRRRPVLPGCTIGTV